MKFNRLPLSDAWDNGFFCAAKTGHDEILYSPRHKSPPKMTVRADGGVCINGTLIFPNVIFAILHTKLALKCTNQQINSRVKGL
jgi:hypothetical protein